jgi:phosphate transport system substrate-binding protein
MNYKILVSVVAIAVIAVGVFSYLSLSSPTQTVTLNGSGATFPYPLLDAMVKQYQTEKTNVQINYQPIGSGGGISALEAKTVDFAASDAPLGAADMAKAPDSLHIPETIGAVTVAYNLPGFSSGLHLTGKVVADIFAGNVTMWNDPEIQGLNSNLTLPAKSILIVHRSDGSGTTFIFTGYLNASNSPAWQAAKLGQGKTVAWPTGIGANGNTGVASVVQGTQYTIGYVELAYVLQNNMTVAAIQNPAGNWIIPSLNSIQLAVQSSASGGLPAGNQSWSNVSLLNAPEPQAYPIVSFTYLLVYQELDVVPGMTQAKATTLVQFLWWVVHDGQQNATSLAYVQLPTNVVQIDETTIKSITFNGQHLPTT